MNAAIRRAHAAILGERRAEERFNVTLKSALIVDGQINSTISIINMSMTGFLAEAQLRYFIGTPVSVHLPGIGEYRATTRWSGNGMLGCEFLRQISEDVFYDLLDTIGSEDRTPLSEFKQPAVRILRQFDA
jgi:hypothetical protein